MSDIPTDLRRPVRRLSRTALVLGAEYDQTMGLALAKALSKCEQLVEKKAAGLEVKQRNYYVTYEVVIDDEPTGGRPGDSTGSMRSPVDGQAADVVLAGVPEGVAA